MLKLFENEKKKGPPGWTRSLHERELCKAWLQNPLENPETGMPIQRGGPTFQMWKQRAKNCGIAERPTATGEITFAKCQEWKKNKSVNPDSGCKIKPGGPKYRWLEQECKALLDRPIELQGVYYLPDTNGNVPTVRSNGTNYILRTETTPGNSGSTSEGGFVIKKVWGPLNTWLGVTPVVVTFFKDTWDYRNGHYRPIFVGRQQPQKRETAKTFERDLFKPHWSSEKQPHQSTFWSAVLAPKGLSSGGTTHKTFTDKLLQGERAVAAFGRARSKASPP